MSNEEQKVDRAGFPEDQSARVDQPMVISVSGLWPPKVIKGFQDTIKDLMGRDAARKIQFLAEPPQADLISTIVRILEEEGCSEQAIRRVKALRLVEIEEATEYRQQQESWARGNAELDKEERNEGMTRRKL